MGTLRDEVYEKLDYLSQLTEIVISPQNELLARLPNRIELSIDDIKSTKVSTYSYQPIGFEVFPVMALRHIVEKKDLTTLVEGVDRCFEFEISPDLELDFQEGRMTGTVALVKKVAQIDDKQLLTLAVREAIAHMHYWQWDKKIKDRTVTVMNILEPGRGDAWRAAVPARGVNASANTAISDLLREVILENKWRIRDTRLIVKLGQWINSYMAKEGDVRVGLVNLMKLKFMVDKDQPIYSIDEVQNVDPTPAS